MMKNDGDDEGGYTENIKVKARRKRRVGSCETFVRNK
jgi:hypothetical protein